jgi:hypothetical protein
MKSTCKPKCLCETETKQCRSFYSNKWNYSIQLWYRNVINHSLQVTQTVKTTHVWIRNLDTEKEGRLEVEQTKFLKLLVAASTETIYTMQ